MPAGASVKTRLRFQFSLRTLLIAAALCVATTLAIVGSYIGRQTYVVAERVAIRERITALGGASNLNGPGMWMWCLGWEEYQAEHVPLVRRWFGDRAEPYLFLPDETPNADMQAIAEAFPEAAIGKVPRRTIARVLKSRLAQPETK
jgi:hypothetical protein